MGSLDHSSMREAHSADSGLIADVSIGQIQRWCAKENAQLIFNCDGTIYAATGDEITHRSLHSDTFAVVLGRLA